MLLQASVVGFLQLRLVGLTLLDPQVVGYREDPRDAVCQEGGDVTICLPQNNALKGYVSPLYDDVNIGSVRDMAVPESEAIAVGPGPEPCVLTQETIGKEGPHRSHAKVIIVESSAVSAAMPVDDSGFVRQIQAGEPQALETVIRTYLGQILRAARGAGLSPQEAEEVTQATFTTFVEKAGRFEGRSRVRTWLFGILYKKIAEARRQLSRSRQMNQIGDIEERFNDKGGWMRPPQALDMQLYGKEIRKLIEDCLEAVPTKQRMAFFLREVEDLPNSGNL